MLLFFFFNDTATTEIYTLSLHDALPISERRLGSVGLGHGYTAAGPHSLHVGMPVGRAGRGPFRRGLLLRLERRSEEHTSELQSQSNLVCRLLLEKKKKDESVIRDTGNMG